MVKADGNHAHMNHGDQPPFDVAKRLLTKACLGARARTLGSVPGACLAGKASSTEQSSSYDASQDICVYSTGDSMRPSLTPNTQIWIRPLHTGGRRLHLGDIVVFAEDDIGAFVCHRVIGWWGSGVWQASEFYGVWSRVARSAILGTVSRWQCEGGQVQAPDGRSRLRGLARCYLRIALLYPRRAYRRARRLWLR